jgi:hypothetical protein
MILGAGLGQRIVEGPSGPEVVWRSDDGSTEPDAGQRIVEGLSGPEVVLRFADGSTEPGAG